MTAARAGAGRRGSAVALSMTALLALVLAACGSPTLPNSVLPGTTATAGWAGVLTSTNTATVAGATPGDLDVEALTRSQFAEQVEGSPVLDEEFGAVTVVDPEEFTVRYDLAEPSWSDGIAVDAADLMLAWAAGSNALAPPDFAPERGEDGVVELPPATPWFDAVPTGLRSSDDLPDFDEFERRVDVTYTEPVQDWQTAIDVAVPAHVVGALAFDLDDPMEAKQAVLTAIVDRDADALTEIARVWSTGFTLGPSSTVPAELLLSSGPYRVDAVDQSRPDAQRVSLAVNLSYAGSVAGEYERLELVQTPVGQRLDLLGETLDVVQVAPTAENWAQVRDLERVDHPVTTAHDGTYRVLVLRTDAGDFRFPAARQAFLGAVRGGDVANAGGGRWADRQEETRVLMFPPSTSGYEIALQDAGTGDGLDLAEDDAIEARRTAGIDDGTEVCVLHDTDDAFAVAALEELRAGVAEVGWSVTDCGTDDLGTAAEAAGDDGWDAVLTTLAVPTSAGEVAELWGSDGAGSWSRLPNPGRDDLVSRLAHEPDAYAARDLRVAIEATIVSDAVALPLAMTTVVTVTDRDIDGVVGRPGRVAPLTSGALDWGVAGS